jgi:hypothetical protein
MIGEGTHVHYRKKMSKTKVNSNEFRVGLVFLWFVKSILMLVSKYVILNLKHSYWVCL